MKRFKHLTIIEFLDYLFNLEEVNKNAIELHLKECELCKEKFLKTQIILKNIILNRNKKNYKKTKNCPDENIISGYIDGRLPPHIQKKFQNHILKCDYCLTRFLEVFYATERLKNISLPSLPEKIKKYITSFAPDFYLKIKRKLNEIKILKSNLVDYKILPVSSALRTTAKYKKNFKLIKFNINLFEIETGFLIIPSENNNINLNIKFESTNPVDITIKILQHKKIIYKNKAFEKKEFSYTLSPGKYDIKFIKLKSVINFSLEII